MIERLPEARLAALRVEYEARADRRVLPQDPAAEALFSECSDCALKQVAEAGIMTLSFAAMVKCWQRGIRVFQRNLTQESESGKIHPITGVEPDEAKKTI